MSPEEPTLYRNHYVSTHLLGGSMFIYSHRSILAFSFIVAIVAVGCGSSRSQVRTKGDRIVLLSGGGFTGASSGYVISENGEVLSWHGIKASSDSLHPLFTLSTDSTDYYFRQLDEIGFTTIEHNAPGNLTYSVEQVRGGSSHIVRWGDARSKPPVSLSDFYARTVEMILSRSQRR